MAPPTKQSRPLGLIIDETLTDLAQDTSAAKPKDSDSEVGPQVSVVTDPDMNGTLPAISDIYNLIATKMNTDIVDRNGLWEPLCGLKGHDAISFTRERFASVTGVCATTLREVAKAAGEINKYLNRKDWSQKEAALKEETDPVFHALVKRFAKVSRDCNTTLERMPESQWRAIALTNYILVGLQYPRIAVNNELRRPAISDISAFLAMNPRNFDIASVRQTSNNAADTNSPEFR
ncbi:hypothetical protein PMG11_09024 [Penicillium brasilianum]|uniref:Uncharacterized protein n=1 Tax=Penicillium brasilianum TaxID=104259 RepID=A0A0F7TX14_PENBI|nr:hypothetical protein PMG11_09024 [Penicillium brasilianum]